MQNSIEANDCGVRFKKININLHKDMNSFYLFLRVRVRLAFWEAVGLVISNFTDLRFH